MLFIAAVALATVSATVLLHAAGTAWWIQLLRRRAEKYERPEFGPIDGKAKSVFGILVQTALVLIGLHVVEVFLWALTYRLVPGSGLSSLEEAIYFSFTTFTTLGYGDITLEGPWRLLTGIEALNGVLLIGWSTALSFAVIQRVWQGIERARTEGSPERPVASRNELEERSCKTPSSNNSELP